MLKKLSLLVITTSMALGLSACNDREVAVGAGAIGGAIIASSVYDHSYHRDYRQSRGYYRDGRPYWDRYDGRYYRRGHVWYRDGRGRDWDRGRGWNRGRDWDHGRHNGRRIWLRTDASDVSDVMSVEVASASADFDAAPNRTAAVAAKYRISRGAADAVINSFENVRRYGKLDAFSRIGMLDQDIQRMAAGRAPSSASVASMARTLGARTSSVKAIMLDVNDEISLRAQGTVREE